MILIILLIYIMGFFVAHSMVGPTHYINGEAIPDDDAQRGIALLWPISLPIFIVSLTVSMVRQMNKFIKPFNTKEKCTSYRTI